MSARSQLGNLAWTHTGEQLQTNHVGHNLRHELYRFVDKFFVDRTDWLGFLCYRASFLQRFDSLHGKVIARGQLFIFGRQFEDPDHVAAVSVGSRPATGRYL